MRKLLHFSLTALLAIAFSFMSQGGVTKAAVQRATIESQTVYTTPDGFVLGAPVPRVVVVTVSSLMVACVWWVMMPWTMRSPWAIFMGVLVMLRMIAYSSPR